jgi:cyclophilin family peptidyl-prolyl cis-trans isomerase
MTMPCPQCGKILTAPGAPGAIAAGEPKMPPSRGPAPPTEKGGGNLLTYGIIGIVVVVVIVFAGAFLTSQNSGPNPIVVIDTSMGTIKVELFQDKSPVTVEYFLKYVDEKHYDGTIFHRVIPGFMIQGGGFEPGMREKKSKQPPIRNEAGNGLTNARGTLAMARTDNPDSATDQFFFNTEDNKKGLDRQGANAGYTVFGKVIDGMDIVDNIARVRTGQHPSGHKDVPLQDVTIKSIRRVEPK